MDYDIRINEYGDKRYYVNNVLHREDGPAVENVNGYNAWYKNGKRHREDGPAIEWFDGAKDWYLNGKYYGANNKFTNESWIKFVKTLIFF